MPWVSLIPDVSVELGDYDTDKSPAYLANYASECGHLFSEPSRVLELGVKRGGSLLLWRDLLPEARIAGLDVDPVELDDAGDRVRVYQGFQQDAEVLDRIAAEVAPDGFDLIIDDASHFGAYTSASFWHLFPRHLKPGGVYVIEDWGTGYWAEWPDGRAYKGSRAALGEQAEAGGPRPAPGGSPDPEGGVSGASSAGALESLRRRVRGSARPLAARLERRSPALRRRLESTYLRAEGAAMRRRFRSHDYGMVGFVKQLIDACAIDVIDRTEDRARGRIRSVNVHPAQVFVHKLR